MGEGVGGRRGGWGEGVGGEGVGGRRGGWVGEMWLRTPVTSIY